MMNEFKSLELLCTGSNIVPSGPGYSPTLGPNQVCTLLGSKAGEQYVKGSDYINAGSSSSLRSQASCATFPIRRTGFQYGTKHLWRNIGIVIAFFVAFQILNMISIEINQGSATPSVVIFERENKERKVLNERLAERKGAARRGELQQDVKGLVRTEKPFTWERLSYTVPVGSGQKRLLNEVYGYVLVRRSSLRTFQLH